jgi:hypothetical protein
VAASGAGGVIAGKVEDPIGVDSSPAAMGDGGTESLEGILTYRGSSERKHFHEMGMPRTTHAEGRIYEFAASTGLCQRKEKHRVRVTGSDGVPSEWKPAPEGALFATASGVIFYNPKEMHATRVAAGADTRGEACICKFGSRCTKEGCPFIHPFVCHFGTSCRDKEGCKFLHPPLSSVVSLGSEYPLTVACKHGTSCSAEKCHFAHPKGRVTVERRVRKLFYTHSLDLEVLPSPKELPLPSPGSATVFQFQGEFAFSFSPYEGPWAKNHYKSVAVHRFCAKAGLHTKLGDYELADHYVNRAVGAQRYLVLSFWPYHPEAMRAMWEATRREHLMEKVITKGERTAAKLTSQLQDSTAALARKDVLIRRKDGALAKKSRDLRRKDGIIARKDAEVQRRDAIIQQQVAQLQATQQREAAAAAEAAQLRKIAAAAEAARRRAATTERTQRSVSASSSSWKKPSSSYTKPSSSYTKPRGNSIVFIASSAHKVRQQKERNWSRMRRRAATGLRERERMFDPIHIFAQKEGTEGDAADDWTLVVDYHKGAHDLCLSLKPGAEGCQQLHIVEHSKVFSFDLVVPDGLSSLGELPKVPGRLCSDF